MRLCIVGLGYVGAVTSVCLARDGHDVFGVDIDATKLDLIRSGRSPVVEEGTQELTQQVVEAGRLQVGPELPSDLGSFDAIFVCVGTPSERSGAHRLEFLTRVATQIGERLQEARGFPVVVIRSTVLPGTTNDTLKPLLEAASGGKAGTDFGLCFQPEFLREGSSIRDFDNPPFTIVGAQCQRSADVLRELFDALPGDFFATDIATAEMLKMSCNAFHALKVTFANEVARIGQSAGVDSRRMMELLCEDRQLNISPAYMKPGFAFGGSCLPKDLRAITFLARQSDVEAPLLQHVLRSNDEHIEHAARLIMAHGSRRISMLGLSFKEGTDDLRESPAVALAERLIGKGFELRIYDPAVKLAQLMGSNKQFIENALPHIGKLVSDDLDEVCAFGDVLVVAQRSATIERTLRDAQMPVVDLVGLPPMAEVCRYEGLCW